MTATDTASESRVTLPDLDFPFDDARRLVRTALDEDLGPRHLDVTTLATIPADQVRSAEIVARAHGVVAGLPVVPLVFDEVSTLVGTGAGRDRAARRRRRRGRPW